MHTKVFIGLSLILACSACDKKADGQTVAVVNNEEITASELNAELSNAKMANDADKKQAVARVLQGLIDRKLLAGQARKDGIDRSPEFITRERRMREDLLIGMLATRQLDTSKLPSDAEISAVQAKMPQAFDKREIWKLEQLEYATPKDAAVRNRLLQSKTIDQLAAALTENRIVFRRGSSRILTNVISTETYRQLAALPPGVPFIVPNADMSVASVIAAREPSPLTGPAARSEAVNAIRRLNSTQLLQQRLKDLRSSAKIEYKQGYGAPK